MFVYYFTALSVELAFLVNQPLPTALSTHIAHWAAAGASIASILVLLLMPFRDPLLPSYNIASVGQTPTSYHRSPEDKLRVWQFLTVYWMAPLMSIGRRRQLNDTDIWLLPFQFQHKRLHEEFRQLKGSLLYRVLRANGIDIFIISLIAIVQLVCGQFPILDMIQTLYFILTITQTSPLRFFSSSCCKRSRTPDHRSVFL